MEDHSFLVQLRRYTYVALLRMKPRFRRPCSSPVWVTLTVILVLCVCALRSMWKAQMCKEKDSILVLQQLCDKYYKGVVAGNLCPHLCDYRTIWFDRCTNYDGGKQALTAKWMDETVVLKSKKKYFEEYDKVFSDFYKTRSSFADMLVNSVQFNFPKRNKEDGLELLGKLWMDGVQKYTESLRDDGHHGYVHWQERAMTSLWSLVQQDEYLMFKLHDRYEHFPKIRGSCGHFYAVEYAPPGSLLSPSLLQIIVRKSKYSWEKRARTALDFLRVIKSFDEDFNETLHMCDMKSDNFGISSDGKLKAIDVDMMSFESRLQGDLGFPNCTSHDDCSYFDCRGWCDVSQKSCTTYRLNNNLQALCEKVFAGGMAGSFSGLLTSPPETFPEITKVLDDCVRPPPPADPVLPGCTTDGSTIQCPTTKDKTLKYKASAEVYDKLERLLKASISET